jgi:hypothetical protein
MHTHVYTVVCLETISQSYVVVWMYDHPVKKWFNVNSYNGNSYNGSSYNSCLYNTTNAATRTTAARLMNWVV